MPYASGAFAEMLGLFTLYARHPETLAHGHQSASLMFSPQGSVTPERCLNIDGLRIFLSAEAI